MWRRHPDNDSAETWGDLVAITKRAARTAEDHDVVLAFEPEVNNVVNSAARARRLIDDVGSPAVKVLMDPANIFKSGELARMQDKLEEAFALLGADIALAHAKDLDHDGEAGHLGAGRGVMDYPLYLSLLQKSGFDGVLVLHQLRGSERRRYRLLLLVRPGQGTERVRGLGPLPPRVKGTGQRHGPKAQVIMTWSTGQESGPYGNPGYHRHT